MQFIEGKNRTQSILFPNSLNQIIDENNEVRIIDLFIESIKLTDFQFVIKTSKEGRPAYHPKDLLKLYVYGYLNHIRSSRQLEKECKRNIELMWLMKELAPDHNTISNFRRDNEKAIRKVFRHTVSIAKHFNLIGGTLVAGDSTKLDEYNKALSDADKDNREIIEQEIKKQTYRKTGYEDMSRQIEQSGETQVSTSDPESRQMMTRNNISEIAYNVQTVVDAKHNLPIDYNVTNTNDTRALSGMLRRTKIILGTTGFTALYDKGYHAGIEIKKALELGIEIMVAIPTVASNAPDLHYNMEHFKYDEHSDHYTCPQNHILNTNGTWYKEGKDNNYYLVKHYKTNACKTCPVKALCTRSDRVRLIERSEYTPFIEANKRNIETNTELYKKRQSIVEHPYGTIKRQWGFYYIMTKKGIKRASADVGFMFTVYNLRRIMNIIDKNILIKFLQDLAFLFLRKWVSLNSIIFKMKNSFLKLWADDVFFSEYRIGSN